jgi:hypothetical protein
VSTAAAARARTYRISLSPGAAAVALTVLGGLLRLYDFSKLSLWFDEGVSIYLARLPWQTLLSSLEAYDTHPPLYPLLLKALGPFLPELYAARLLSVVAGTLSVYVVYVLGRRLLGAAVGVLACAFFAISPLHIWYSQEARMYALVAMSVLLSYLALVAFHQDLRAGWAVAYTVSVLVALYLDYSSIYSLAPQALILLWVTRVHGRRSLPIWVAAIAVVLGFMPWLPRMLGTVGAMTMERAPALGVTPGSVAVTLVSIVGLAGHDRYFLGSMATLWDARPQWHLLMALALVPLVIVGAIALLRRGVMPVLAVGGLLVGTLGVGILISLYRPGFAERTVLSATAGWSLLAAAAVALPSSRVIRTLAALSLLFALAGTTMTLNAIYAGADKDHWSAVAADADRARALNLPVVTYHSGVEVLLGLYAPRVLEQQIANLGGSDNISAPFGPGKTPPRAFWFIYIGLPPAHTAADQMRNQGYERVLHNNYSKHSLNPIYMDLYAQPGTPLLEQVHFNGAFAGEGERAEGWTLPATGVDFEAGAAGERTLTLQAYGSQETRAYAMLPARPHEIYRVDLQAQSQLDSGRVRAFLLCATNSQGLLEVAPDDAGATVPNDGAWHEVSISVSCPTGTEAVIVDLRNAGQGTTFFRDVDLQRLRLPQPVP